MTAAKWIAVLVVASSGAALAQPKQATPKVDCEFFEATGSKAKEPSIDPELRPIEKKLKKLPWNTTKQLAHGTQTLQQLKAEGLPVKWGKASVMLNNIVGKSQVQLVVTIDDPAGKRVTNTTTLVSAADYVMWVNETPNDTAHILALTCK